MTQQRSLEEFVYQCVSLVYVLELEDDCWYVGVTSHLNSRLAEHFGLQGRCKGANWTSQHKPLAIHEVVVGDYQTENEMTEEYIAMYGADKVQGGKYIKRSPKKKVSNRACPICGKGHNPPFFTKKRCMRRFIEAFEIELKPCKIYNLDE